MSERPQVQPMAVLKMARLLKQCLILETLSVRFPRKLPERKRKESFPMTSLIENGRAQVLELVGLHLSPHSLLTCPQPVSCLVPK